MNGPDARMAIRTKLGPLVLGESISVDGVCLTVDAIEGDTFLIDGPELQQNRRQIEIETELLEALSA